MWGVLLKSFSLPSTVVASVVPDNNTPGIQILVSVLEVFQESLSCLYDNQIVHLRETRPHPTPQPRCAELHPLQKHLGQGFCIFLGQQLTHFFVLVFILRQPQQKRCLIVFKIIDLIKSLRSIRNSYFYKSFILGLYMYSLTPLFKLSL